MRKFRFGDYPYALILIFVLASAFIFFVMALTYKHLEKLSENTYMVNHSQEISLKLEQLYTNLKDIEIERRNYILLQNEDAKPNVEKIKKDITEILEKLKPEFADNSLQQENLARLDILIERKYKIVNTIFDKTDNNYNKEELHQSLAEGQQIVADINTRINQMMEIENRILTKRKAEFFFVEKSTPFYIYLTAIVSLGLLSFTFYRLYQDSQKQKKNNEKLEMSVNTSNLAEAIGNYGIWTYDSEQKTFSYSENEYRIFGYNPKDPEVQKIDLVKEFKNIHPEDRSLVEEMNKTLLDGKDTLTFNFRIIRQDGIIRHFKTNRRKVSDSGGRSFTLGITTDITDEVIANQKIEENNRNLENQNKELMAFNYVASHDLQEPLRKIETFLSRLKDKDYDSLSEAGKQYFDRTLFSAGRMRNLIDDLLQFSRATRSDQNFEITDINTIFENTIENFHQLIEEKNAEITSDTFPNLRVIPFQIQQLFTNIIGNSLKYSKENIPVKIKVSCQLVDYTEIQKFDSELNKNQRFYRFVFSDNGIGFNNDYAPQIFDLFHRLHGKMEYEGTGIGLAICKKIVDNHRGYIFAEGKENEGATFTMYLPKI